METSSCRCRDPQGLHYSSQPADVDAMGEGEWTTNAATRTTVTEVLLSALSVQRLSWFMSIVVSTGIFIYLLMYFTFHTTCSLSDVAVRR
jgi:hypothetical protein